MNFKGGQNTFETPRTYYITLRRWYAARTALGAVYYLLMCEQLFLDALALSLQRAIQSEVFADDKAILSRPPKR